MKKMLKARSICWVVFSTHGVHVSTPSLKVEIEPCQRKVKAVCVTPTAFIFTFQIVCSAHRVECARFHLLNHLKVKMPTRYHWYQFHFNSFIFIFSAHGVHIFIYWIIWRWTMFTEQCSLNMSTRYHWYQFHFNSLATLRHRWSRWWETRWRGWRLGRPGNWNLINTHLPSKQ